MSMLKWLEFLFFWALHLYMYIIIYARVCVCVMCGVLCNIHIHSFLIYLYIYIQIHRSRYLIVTICLPIFFPQKHVDSVPPCWFHTHPMMPWFHVCITKQWDIQFLVANNQIYTIITGVNIKLTNHVSLPILFVERPSFFAGANPLFSSMLRGFFFPPSHWAGVLASLRSWAHHQSRRKNGGEDQEAAGKKIW